MGSNCQQSEIRCRYGPWFQIIYGFKLTIGEWRETSLMPSTDIPLICRMSCEISIELSYLRLLSRIGVGGRILTLSCQ